MKPDNPIVYNEFYLDAMTGGSSELPAPVTPEQHYLAHLAGMTVSLPQPIILRDMFLAKICGMDVNVPTYIPGQFPRKFAYYAKAAGQDVDVPQPITREEMYWFDYVSTPTEKEYTGAVPVTFTANGQPLLDYLISGNTVQNGTPTPDSPVMPQGTGERSSQLIPYPFYSSDGKYAGVQFTTDNGRIIANGTLTSGLLYYLWRPAKFQAGTYTMSVKGKHSGATIYFRDTTNSVSVAYIYGSQEGDRSVTFTVAEEISAMVYINAGSGSIDFDCTIMLNAGEEALPFEHTNGIKIPISSAGQTNNIYLGEVETTRRIKKLVLTGEETIPNNDGASYNSETSTDRFVRDIPLSVGDNGTSEIVLCTHLGFQAQSWAARTKTGCCIYCSGSTMQLHLRFNNNTLGVTQSDTNEQRTAKLKAFLATQYAAGTPVTVWYVLANEETAVVNEPLMRIGDYADTVSMEQAVVEIPTARGTNTLDVLTDVKPSEIYIKYKE